MPATLRSSTRATASSCPGFIDTHHHQFETALRSFLADGLLINDASGSPSGNTTYYEYILNTFAPVYRPQDVYINELFGGLSQLDDGVTTVLDVSQIHHSAQHSDAAVQALFDTGRRAAFGYFESAGRRSRQRLSDRRLPPQAALVLLDRSTRHHGHGRRGLSWRLDDPAVVDDRPSARPADRGAYPLAVRHPPDHGRARPGPGRQRSHRHRPRQPVHPHDRHVGHGLEQGQTGRRAGLARRPDRDEHASRHAADHQDAAEWAWSRRCRWTSSAP